MVILLARGNSFITVILLNLASIVLNLVLYIPKLKLNILNISRLLKYRARIIFV